MNALKVCMLAIPALISVIIIKQWKSDFSALLRVALVILFGSIALGSLSPVIGYLKTLLGEEQLLYTTVLFKALGIGFLAHYAAEICRESGESGLAGGVETVGKIEILLLCLPLTEEILTVAKDLLALGG